ncbi:MAG: peptidase MA family metallohydrolase [bacterium]|nr:peptidase MA family metallohydrolase [bacterium]
MTVQAFIFLALLAVAPIETRHFEFSYSAEDQKLAGELAGKIESIRDEIVATIGYDSPEKIEILLAGPERIAAETSTLKNWIPPWVSAVAIPEKRMVILKTRGQRAGLPFEPEKILTHELVHMVLGPATGHHPIPTWLNEGLAMFLAREWKFQHTFILFKASLGGVLPRLSGLDLDFSGTEDEVRLAYGLSFSFISFLLESYGKDRVREWIGRIGNGQAWEEAFSEAFPKNFYQAENEWRKKLKLRYAWAPFIFSGTGIWFLAALLFVLGYLAKRRRSEQTLNRWRQEEGYPLPEEDDDDPIDPTVH